MGSKLHWFYRIIYLLLVVEAFFAFAVGDIDGALLSFAAAFGIKYLGLP